MVFIIVCCRSVLWCIVHIVYLQYIHTLQMVFIIPCYICVWWCTFDITYLHYIHMLPMLFIIVCCISILCKCIAHLMYHRSIYIYHLSRICSVYARYTDKCHIWYSYITYTSIEIYPHTAYIADDFLLYCRWLSSYRVAKTHRMP